MKGSLPKINEEEKKQAAHCINAFALDLYQKLKKQDGNLFFSPLSISSCLAMAYAGARGETAKQMAHTLHFPLDQERLHLPLGRLIAHLNAGAGKHSYQLVVANALWGQQDYGFFKEFVDLLRRNYGSELHELDFQTQTEAARQAINRWVEEQTQDKIKSLIGPGALDPLTRLLLTNAIYFKGNWHSPFDEDSTHPAPFAMEAGPSGGQAVAVSMMAQTGDFGYMEDEGFQALELPYDGDALSMVIFLPRRVDGLLAFECLLTPETLMAWLPALRTQEVKVFFPKFKMTSGFQLGQILQSMGISDAFTLGTADFSGMTDGENLAIAEVIHKAFVEVNEKGTEAVAATALDLCFGEPEETPPIPVFRADHPFIFLIRDIRSDSILFLGRVVDPADVCELHPEMDKFYEATDETVIDPAKRADEVTDERVSDPDEPPVVKLVNMILIQCIEKRARAIEFERCPTHFSVRFQLAETPSTDADVLRPPLALWPSLIARIKHLAGMVDDRPANPNDGQMVLKLPDKQAETFTVTISSDDRLVMQRDWSSERE